MGYANLVSQACGDASEVFRRLRDFVCRRSGSYDYSATGIGWTLHDAVYATDEDTVAYNDYFVIYSPGEDGDQDIYLKITYLSGYINVHAYLYWDASTHTGVSAASTSSNWTATASTVATLWIYGDLDGIVPIAKYGSTYYGTSAGHMPGSALATTVATSSSAVSAGSSVVVTVDAVPSGWAVGRKIYIRDTSHVEIVTISAISGADVTLASVVNSYAAGCKLQGEYSVYCSSGNYLANSIYPVIAHNGSLSLQHNVDSTSTPGSTRDDGLVGGSPLVPVMMSALYSCMGPLAHVWMINSYGRTAEQTETDQNGATYRYFPCYSAKYIVVKEV